MKKLSIEEITQKMKTAGNKRYKQLLIKLIKQLGFTHPGKHLSRGVQDVEYDSSRHWESVIIKVYGFRYEDTTIYNGSYKNFETLYDDVENVEITDETVKQLILKYIIKPLS